MTLPVSTSRKIKVGSRGSRLAIAQVAEIFSLLRGKNITLSFEQMKYETAGDKDKVTPLSQNPPDDFFTDQLDRALLAKEIDVAVHSAKDLPKTLKKGLAIFALTKALDSTDAFVGRAKIADLKKGAKIGTSSSIRKEALETLYPGIKPVNIRGTIDERLTMVDEGELDGVIVATCALKRLGLADRIKEILSYEATPLQGQLAVVGRSGDEKLKDVFAAIDARTTYGQVTLVGAGPGDPELITLKAIKALEQADVVFYDYLIPRSLLDYAKKGEKIYVGKRKGDHALPQAELSKMIKDKAMEGKNVVRLKGGDPLIFGRGADEIEYLRSYHIGISVIPGVSSATGVASHLGIPLTARRISSSVAFISGHAEDEESMAPQPVSIPKVDTIVFLMGLTKLGMIVKSLRQAGWKDSSPISIISKGTYPDEKIIRSSIADIEKLAAGETLEQPALIIAGEVVKFWQGEKPMQDVVLYLGTNPEKYKRLGQIIHLPMVEISSISFSREDAKRLTENFGKYQLIIFTSRFAVQYFMETLQRVSYPVSRLDSADFAVIGQETAATLRKYRIEPKVIASTETSEGFLDALMKHYDLGSKKILFPRSSLPNPYLKKELMKRGADVTEIAIYENKKPSKRDVSFESVTRVVFTSPSTVKNFLTDYGAIPKHWKILSKGPFTTEALKEAGYESEVLSDDEIS